MRASAAASMMRSKTFLSGAETSGVRSDWPKNSAIIGISPRHPRAWVLVALFPPVACAFVHTDVARGMPARLVSARSLTPLAHSAPADGGMPVLRHAHVEGTGFFLPQQPCAGFILSKDFRRQSGLYPLRLKFLHECVATMVGTSNPPLECGRMFEARFQSFDDHSDRAATAPRVAALRGELKRRELDGFIVPRADRHQNETVPDADERLAWL